MELLYISKTNFFIFLEMELSSLKNKKIQEGTIKCQAKTFLIFKEFLKLN